MDISSIYVKWDNPNEIAIVTKFTKKIADNLLVDFFGITYEPKPKDDRFFKLMYLRSSKWYCKGIPAIIVDDITWNKKICIMVNLTTHRVKIEIDNRTIDEIMANYESLEVQIGKSCSRDINLYKANILKVKDQTSDPKSTLDGVRVYIKSNGSITPETQHEEWMKSKLAGGWVYGKEKNIVKKTHPCLVPYNELPVEEQVKDYIFQLAIERELDKYKPYINALNR